ncbi:MAG: hypothetical protein DWI02_12395 [Planctomycetota bacterium]|jgi:hypothetical protein|nr:MAG: hypothetical protein DWI02_12395 [Planctomycetota bacterium]
MSHNLWQDLHQFLWSWWSHDQIRTSPAEGRLLRVEPGDILTVRGLDVTVLERAVIESPAGPGLQFTCRTATGTGELQLTIPDQGPGQGLGQRLGQVPLQLVWQESDGPSPIHACEIEVWPRAKRIGLQDPFLNPKRP